MLSFPSPHHLSRAVLEKGLVALAAHPAPLAELQGAQVLGDPWVVLAGSVWYGWV